MDALLPTKRILGDERGFTLPEVLVTIIILGILAGIAIPSWFGVVESRAVDSATNQVVADLRLTTSKASNRLTSHRIKITVPSPPANPNTYEIGPTGGPFETRTLPDGTEISTGTNIIIAFCANGSAEYPPSSPVCPNGTATPFLDSTTTITVASDDGDPSTNVEVNTANSRVTVVP